MAEQARLEQLENLLKENYKKLNDLDRRQKEVEESKETKTSKQSILRSIRHERSTLKKDIISLSVEKSKIEFPVSESETDSEDDEYHEADEEIILRDEWEVNGDNVSEYNRLNN